VRLACALLLSLPALGCVSASQYQEASDERDLLRDERSRLEASVENLESDRARLADQLEDQRIENDALKKQRGELSRRRSQLEQRLLEAEVPADGSTTPELAALRDQLAHELETEVAVGLVEISAVAGGLRLRAAEELLFAPGGAELNDAGRLALERIASIVRERSERIDVQGHVDAPPSGALAKKFPTAWDLAAARAIAVVKRLGEKGVPAARLAAVSRGDANPVAAANEPGAATRNRRIELRLLADPLVESPNDVPPPAPPVQ
jgi:chemotaxis protein MotB